MKVLKPSEMKYTMKIKQIYNFRTKLYAKNTRVSSKEIARMNAQATQSMVSILTNLQSFMDPLLQALVQCLYLQLYLHQAKGQPGSG